MMKIAWRMGIATLAGCLAVPALCRDNNEAPATNVASPPAATCSAGPYIVFFERDKAAITPEAATILDSAIAAYDKCDNAPITLAGHADRSGSDKLNMSLSRRRNASVRAYLTGHGVAGAAIISQAFGETAPRVPTSDGVSEAQNRRVEITFAPSSGG
jgi:outer membrane protein OmpA-like peptidoglycan-associated protein